MPNVSTSTSFWIVVFISYEKLMVYYTQLDFSSDCILCVKTITILCMFIGHMSLRFFIEKFYSKDSILKMSNFFLDHYITGL